MAKNRKDALWNFFDNLAGDKVVWMIVLMLILSSAVCIFSSTALMTSEKLSRTDIIIDQLNVIGLGLVFILFFYFVIRDVKWYKRLASLCFLLSLAALIFLQAHMKIGELIKADTINGAWRVIKVGGIQVHIFEFIKVAMILYLAWAVDTYEKKGFTLMDKLSEIPHLKWLAKPATKRVTFIYLPALLITVLIAKGSGSSALFMLAVMTATIFISGLWYGKMKKLIFYAVCIAAVGAVLVFVGGPFIASHFERAETWASRLKGTDDYVEQFMDSEKGSSEYYNSLDKFRQQYSAKIAVHEGGLIGKGPGQSTQRYVVPVMYEDYMYSFILEEYGLLGGIVVIILYMSLLARGSVIVRNCNDRFAQIVVAGLVLLITGQAMLHIMVNVGLMPLTGQTLPMISHGATSFVAFSIAFGIMLSISRIARKSIEKETSSAEPIINSKPEVESSLDDLDAAEDDIIENI